MKEQEAVDTLKAFFTAMRQWIIDNGKLYPDVSRGLIKQEDYIKKQSDALLRIFDEFVIYKGSPRRMTLEGGFAFDPSEYNIDKEHILNIEHVGKKMKITTQFNFSKFVYTLKETPQGWKIFDGREHTIKETPVGVHWL
jgi:hypothetical protein